MNLPELYHCSAYVYVKNQEVMIPNSQQNHFQAKIKRLNNEWIEDELEKYNPHAKKNIRKTSIFLFDNPYAALYFGKEEYLNQSIHIYKCLAFNCVKCIMPAIRVLKSHEHNELAKKKICEEYWNPQKKYYYFYEYLTEKTTIIDVLPSEKIGSENQYNYVVANYSFECDECESVLN